MLKSVCIKAVPVCYLELILRSTLCNNLMLSKLETQKGGRVAVSRSVLNLRFEEKTPKKTKKNRKKSNEQTKEARYRYNQVQL